MLFSLDSIKTDKQIFTGENMETVKISKVEGKMSKTNKAFYYVTFDDGRKATSWDASVRDMGGATVLAEFKQNGDFLNVKIVRVLQREDRPGDVPSGAPVESIASEKPGINPVFVFLGTCSMVAPILSEALNSGADVETASEIIRKHFGTIYDLNKDLFKIHMKLDEYADVAEKLM